MDLILFNGSRYTTLYHKHPLSVVKKKVVIMSQVVNEKSIKPTDVKSDIIITLQQPQILPFVGGNRSVLRS